MLNIDLTDSVVYSLSVEKDTLLNKTFIAEVYSGDTFTGYFPFSAYTASTLTVKKNPKSFSVLTFSTADNSIQFGDNGEFSLSKDANEMFISSGNYLYEMFLYGTGGTRGFLRGKFLVVDEAYGEIQQDIDNNNYPFRIRVKNDIAVQSSTGGTSNITANNGLTKSGSNIHLGGALTGNTTIDGNEFNINLGASSNDRMGNLRVWSNGTISLDGRTSSFLQSSGSTITATPQGISLSAQSGQLNINSTNFTITDNRATPRGLSANADYSANYEDLDYVSKLYVDNKVLTGSTTANNGLTKVGSNIVLGGALTGDTTIDTNNNNFLIDLSGTSGSIKLQNTFDFFGAGNEVIGLLEFSSSSTVLSTRNNLDRQYGEVRLDSRVNLYSEDVDTNKNVAINVDISDFEIEDNRDNPTGIKYAADYSNDFIPRSLVDKGYVTGITSTLVTTANNGLTKTGGNIYLGGELTGSTIVGAGSSNFSIIGDNSSFELLQDGPVNIISNNGVNIADALGVGLSIQSADGLGDSVIANISPNVFTIDGPTSFAGLQYGVDYGANFTTRSLVDVGFLDGRYTAANGITKSGTKFSLGGTITGNTSINSNVANTHSFIIGGTTRPQTIQLNAGNVLSNYGNLTINDTQTSLTRNVSNPMSIVLDASGIRISDLLNARGAFYAGDYSANFTPRSLVDKGYVTGITSTLTTTANNGLTKSGNNIHLGGALTGNTTLTTTGFDFTISNSGTVFSIKSAGTVQLNLGGDATNDIYSRNSSGNLQRIAAGTGSTLLMMNTGGTGHIYSKITSNNIADNAVTTNAINNSAVTIAKLANAAGGTRIIGRSAVSSGVYGEIVATADGQSLRRVGGILGFGNATTVSFTVATLPTATPAGQMIYVSDESGGAVIAFSDGTNWRRVTDRAIVS